MRRFAAPLICLCSLLLCAPQVMGAEDILEQIPANAKVAVIVKDIPTLQKNLRAFVEKLDVPVPPDAIDFDNLLEMIGIQTKLGKQAAFVITEPAVTGMTVIVELADPEGAKKLDSLEKTDDEDEFLVNLMGIPALVAIEDGFAFVQFTVEDDEGLEVFDDIKESLGDVLNDAQKKAIKDTELFFVVNVKEWREVAIQGLAAAEEAMKAGFEQAGGEESLNTIPGMSMKGYFEWIFKSARSLVEQTKSLYGGIHLSADHAKLLISTEFEEGSYLAKVTPKTTTKTSDFFADLPVLPYLMAGGSDIKSTAKPMRDFIDGFYGSMFANMKKEDLDAIKKAMNYFDYTDRMNMLIGVGGPNGLEGAGIFFSSDPARLMKEYKATLTSSQKITELFYGKSVEIKPVEKVVDEHKVTEVAMDMSAMFGKLGVQEDAAGLDPASMISAIYGGTKIISQIEQIEEGLGYAVSAKENPILLLDSDELLSDDPSAKETIALLPAKSIAAGLIDPFQFFRMIGKIVSATVPDSKFPEPDADAAKSPPIGLAVTTDSATVHTHVVVSTKTIKSLIAYVMQLSQMPGPAPQFPAEPENGDDKT